jgi:oligoendopeptidase F
MFENLSHDPVVFIHWTWSDYAPYADDLKARSLTTQTMEGWLQDWTHLAETIYEQFSRLSVAMQANTLDEEARKRYNAFIEDVYPRSLEVEQVLKEILLKSKLELGNFQIVLRNLRAEADLFRQENLPLLSEEKKLNSEYDKVIGAQTVIWDGRELTISQLRPIYQENDRELRERAWHLAAERQLADRQPINALWQKFLALRLQIARNAGKPDYRAYRWQDMLRFDYTPEDCRKFHAAIEQVVVPAALRIYDRRRARLGLSSLRPWDLNVEVTGKSPLRPFSSMDEFKNGVAAIFHHVHPELGGHFAEMIRLGHLDLENRKNKAPGGFCADFPVMRRPFIFMNAVGVHADVQTLLHEGGHAFHVFESAALPYIQQLSIPMEFAEVASMSMELLASPYLTAEQGGFYSSSEAARALIEHLEGMLLFWPYMAVADAFQHWVYENPVHATDPAQCDSAWARLWERFMIGVDWSGLEEIKKTGWQRKQHIHTVPFYYIEYGLAQLGATQVWASALRNQGKAVADYRKALALGGTATLPQLYQTAGARLAFDADTLLSSVTLIEDMLEKLEAKI